MPCRSDYLEPTQKEKAIRKTVELTIWLKRELGLLVTDKDKILAEDNYPHEQVHDEVVANLCSLIRGLNPRQMDEIVYNGRDKDSRRLADWWDAHKEADEKREAEESRKERLIASVKGKLSAEELDVIKFV